MQAFIVNNTYKFSRDSIGLKPALTIPTITLGARHAVPLPNEMNDYLKTARETIVGDTGFEPVTSGM